MLRFLVFRDGVHPPALDLSAAYVIGPDLVPIKAEFTYANGQLVIRKRAAGPASLCLMWDVKNFGTVLLDTTRLPERDDPYNLNIELARGRLMRFTMKREEWGLHDLTEAQIISDKADACRDLLIEAIVNSDNPPVASHYADRCLTATLPLSEQAALTHADILLQRRLMTGSLPKNAFGLRVDLHVVEEDFRKVAATASDFVCLPMPWRMIEPAEQEFEWTLSDDWVEYMYKRKVPMMAGALVQFSDNNAPDWIYTWEHDYETIRDFLVEHIDRVVSRYGTYVSIWNVLSGLHVNNQLSFSFDQLMDLTRLTVHLVKKIAPGSRTLVELTQPWGEYYALNQRSIPPMLYAEMLVQSGVDFDLFGLNFRFGAPRDGGWQRDLFQISGYLDRFAALGKQVIVTIEAPSDMNPEAIAAGCWRRTWNETIQSRWLESVTDICLSKPYVEAICWGQLADNPQGTFKHNGLMTQKHVAKQSLQTWSALRKAAASFRARNGKTPVTKA